MLRDRAARAIAKRARHMRDEHAIFVGGTAAVQLAKIPVQSATEVAMSLPRIV